MNITDPKGHRSLDNAGKDAALGRNGGDALQPKAA